VSTVVNVTVWTNHNGLRSSFRDRPTEYVYAFILTHRVGQKQDSVTPVGLYNDCEEFRSVQFFVRSKTGVLRVVTTFQCSLHKFSDTVLN